MLLEVLERLEIRTTVSTVGWGWHLNRFGLTWTLKCIKHKKKDDAQWVTRHWDFEFRVYAAAANLPVKVRLGTLRYSVDSPVVYVTPDTIKEDLWVLLTRLLAIVLLSCCNL